VFADTIVTLRAQRSRFFGPDGISYQYAAGASDPNLKSDFFWQRIHDSGLIAGILKKKPPAGPTQKVRALYRGFAAGYNAYLRSGRLSDPACKGKPWVTPIKAMDLYLRGAQIAMFATAGQLVSGMVDAQPPGVISSSSIGSAEERSGPTAPGAAPEAPPAGDSDSPGPAADGEQQEATPELEQLDEQFPPGPAADGLGSNGVALGSKGTRNGNSLLLSNPHFPWRGSERFWMARLRVPGSYNVMGGTLFGLPFVAVGFNRDMAWTHTVSTARRFVLYQLQLVPGDPTSYVVDGKTYKMETETVTVDGKTHTFYNSILGPMVNVPAAGYLWNNSTAFALGDYQADNLRAANQYLAMGQARSVGQLLRVERRYLGIPNFNTIAIDRRGRALYADVGAIPNVPQSSINTCIPSGLPQFVYNSNRVITLDGSRSACTPKRGAGAPADGIFGPGDLPSLSRRDYVANANDSYWLANPSQPLTGFSPIIGLEGTPQGFRTRDMHLRVRKQLGRFSLRKLKRLWQSDRNYSADLTARPLAAACAASPLVTLADASTVDLSGACPVLAAYGRTGNLDDPGAWLFNEWVRRAPGITAGLFADPFNPARPLETPSTLATANIAVLRALGTAVKALQAQGVPLNATLRQTQFATRGSARIPVHGCLNCFNAIQAGNGTPSQNSSYGEVIHGSSVVMLTELTDKGPRVQGILTYSQATDPTSPWFKNMTKLYSKKKWVVMRFSRRQLAADKGARRVRIPGSR
jgi:acyl-homoserine-lactone acylase